MIEDCFAFVNLWVSLGGPNDQIWGLYSRVLGLLGGGCHRHQPITSRVGSPGGSAPQVVRCMWRLMLWWCWNWILPQGTNQLQLSADTPRLNYTHFLVYAKTVWQDVPQKFVVKSSWSLVETKQQVNKHFVDREKRFARFLIRRVDGGGLNDSPNFALKLDDKFSWCLLKPSEKDVRKWRAPTNSIDFATQLDLSKRNLGGNVLEIPISVARETVTTLLLGPRLSSKEEVHRMRGFFTYAPSFSKQFLQSLPTTQKNPKKAQSVSLRCLWWITADKMTATMTCLSRMFPVSFLWVGHISTPIFCLKPTRERSKALRPL